MTDLTDEPFADEMVTYSLLVDGKFIIVENVPARVSLRTGERLFSPQTVERLHEIVWADQRPTRVLQTPVFEFSAVPA